MVYVASLNFFGGWDHDIQLLGTFSSISVDFLLFEDDAALQNSTANT